MEEKKDKRLAYITREEFDKYTPEQRRVVVAKDVLAGLAAKRLVAKSGDYVKLKVADKQLFDSIRLDNKAEVCDLLATSPECHVCAKGALFVAMVERFDRLKIGEAVGRSLQDRITYHSQDSIGEAGIRYPLAELFGEDQIDLIEQTFEGFDGIDNSDALDNEDYDAANAWHSAMASDDSVEGIMSAIMQNIIANDGTLVIPSKYY